MPVVGPPPARRTPARPRRQHTVGQHQIDARSGCQHSQPFEELERLEFEMRRAIAPAIGSVSHTRPRRPPPADPPPAGAAARTDITAQADRVDPRASQWPREGRSRRPVHGTDPPRPARGHRAARRSAAPLRRRAGRARFVLGLRPQPGLRALARLPPQASGTPRSSGAAATPRRWSSRFICRATTATT